MSKDIEKYKTSSYGFGLTKMLGVKIKEVHGYVTTEFDEPTFKMTQIELEDGIIIACEGEHDMPYLAYNDKLDDICQDIHDATKEE